VLPPAQAQARRAALPALRHLLHRLLRCLLHPQPEARPAAPPVASRQLGSTSPEQAKQGQPREGRTWKHLPERMLRLPAAHWAAG
jgi:hypothetical protein